MSYTPSELAQADQNLAALTRELALLVESERDTDHSITAIEELAHAVLASLDMPTMAVTLSIAVHQLARRQGLRSRRAALRAEIDLERAR